jgi:hypothetical protein
MWGTYLCNLMWYKFEEDRSLNSWLLIEFFFHFPRRKYFTLSKSPNSVLGPTQARTRKLFAELNQLGYEGGYLFSFGTEAKKECITQLHFLWVLHDVHRKNVSLKLSNFRLILISTDFELLCGCTCVTVNWCVGAHVLLLIVVWVQMCCC